VGILSGAMSVRRFRVAGEVPEGFRTTYRDQLNAFAFREPLTGQGKEETEGWVLTRNLLDTDFTDHNQWLFEPYALIALRVDKKTLPARLVRAMLQKRCEAWCEERDVKRCPASVRSDLLDNLESELLAKTLPKVAVTEACWNFNAGYLVLGSSSETVIDRFRKRFYQTFGLTLVPASPLDWLASSADVEALLAVSPADITPSSSDDQA